MDANGSLVVRCSLAALATLMLLLALSPPVRAQGISRPPRANGVAVLAVEFNALQTALDKILAKDPSFAEAHDALMSCVDAKVLQGELPTTPTQAHGTVTAALEGCASELGIQLPKFGLASYYGLAGIGKGNVAPSVTCAAPGYDARAAGGWDGWIYGPKSKEAGRLSWDDPKVAPPDLTPHRDQLGGNNPTYKELERAANEAWEAWMTLLGDTAKALPNAGAPVSKEALQKLDAAEKKANDAIRKRDAYRPPRADNDDGGGDDTGVARTDPNAVDACAAAAQQIAECARDGWTTVDCQRLKRRLDGCMRYDEDVYDPAPDAEPRECGSHELTAEEAATVLRTCESRVLYGPEGGSPCVGDASVSAVINPAIGWFCIKTGDQQHCYTGANNPCGGTETNPAPTSEYCAGHATLLSISRTTADVLATAFAKLGGPVWRPPGGSGPPGPGGPDPGRG
jgi:hypothetical protein